MRFPASAVKPSPVVLAAVILVFALSAFAQKSPPLATPPSANSINMLVLGDSILWGQGLKDEHKSWYLVKAWLEGSNGIRVHETVVAHAGAVIGTAGEKPPQSLTLYGEVSSAWPTLHDQVDDALRAFADPAEVDVVLVDAPPPPPETELRDAMLRRVSEWRRVLIERHIDSCRGVLQRLVGRFELIDERTYPEYVRNLPRTIPEDVAAVRPAFAAFLRPEGFLDTDTYGMASPPGFDDLCRVESSGFIEWNVRRSA